MTSSYALAETLASETAASSRVSEGAAAAGKGKRTGQLLKAALFDDDPKFGFKDVQGTLD